MIYKGQQCFFILNILRIAGRISTFCSLFPSQCYSTFHIYIHRSCLRYGYWYHTITTYKNMNNQKQFGVWMDSHQAVVVGKENIEEAPLSVLAHVKAEDISPNSNEKNSNIHEKTLQVKYFKEIASYLVNATHVHATGTGQAQEQFIHYLADTPQFLSLI